jgi:hypothetical protein
VKTAARLLAILMLTTLVGPPAAAESGDTIIYLAPDRSARYRAVIDGNGTVRVLANIDSITAPAVSRDGTRIAFSGSLGDESIGRFGIFVVNSDGSGLVQLTDGNLAEYDPAWSPDGETIAVAWNQFGSLSTTSCCRLAVVDVQSRTMTGLTLRTGVARPSYSPNGGFIVYDTPEGVWRIPSNGGVSKLLAKAGGFDATVSGDNLTVAYLASDGMQLRSVASGGGPATLLYSTTNRLENPVWVNDRIYFLEHAGLGYDGRKSVTLRSIRSDGTGARIERSFGYSAVGLSPVDGNDEMFFYRDGDGSFRYYDISASAVLGSPIQSGFGYSKGWSSIVALDLDGDGTDEMLFYRADDGTFKYYDMKPSGRLASLIRSGTGYSRGWSTICSVDLDGDGQDEIFFYRTDGTHRYYNISANAALGTAIVAGSGYSKNWSAITSVDLNG